MNRRYYIAIVFLVICTSLSKLTAQNVSINADGAAPHNSAMLDVDDTTRGFLPPRMNTTQMNAISSPATGLFVYNTDTVGYCYYNGTAWRRITSGSLTPNLNSVLGVGNDAGADTIVNLNALNIGSSGTPDASLVVDSFLLLQGTPYSGFRWFGHNTFYDGVSADPEYLNDGYADIIAFGVGRFIMGHWGNATAGTALPNNANTSIELADSVIEFNGVASDFQIRLNGNVEVDSLSINSLYSLPGNAPNIGEVLRFNGTNLEWGSNTIESVSDADTDTRIETDAAGSDEDTLRFFVEGAQVMNMDSTRISALKNIEIPATQGDSMGVITQNGTRFIHTYQDAAAAFGRNLYIGEFAGNFTQDGDAQLNTGVGWQSLTRVTSGSANAAFGYRSLDAIESGRQNTAIGYNAMRNDTTGSFNTGIGAAALRFSNGEHNTAVGHHAMRFALGTPTGNTVIGAQAMYLQQGIYNVAIGDSAGYNNVGGVRNIFIGSKAGLNEAGSYKLYIEPDSTSTPLIYGDFFTDSLRFNGTVETSSNLYIPSGNVGIGTASPFGELMVSGADSTDLNLMSTSATNHWQAITFGYNAGSNLIGRMDLDNNSFDIKAANGRSIDFYTQGAQAGSSLDTATSLELGMTITGSGFLGVGTFSPSSNLHVFDNINGEMGIRASNANSGGYSILRLENDAGENAVLFFNGSGRSIDGGVSSTTLRNDGAGDMIVTSTSGDVVLQPNGRNVGIGTDAPADRLHLSDDVGDVAINIEADSDNNDENDNPYIIFKQDGATTFGRLGLEGTDGSTYTNSLGNAMYLGMFSPNDLQFVTNGANRMTIESTGDVGIGTNAPTRRLDIIDNQTSTPTLRIENEDTGTNSSAVSVVLGTVNPTSSNEFAFFFGSAGSATVGTITGNGSGGVNYNTTSDRRLKTDIQDMNNALGMISEIQPRVYRRIANPDKLEYGFIAQELYEVFPQAVSGTPDGDVNTDPMGVDYGQLTPLLVKAIQELNERVSLLEEANAAKQKRIEMLLKQMRNN